MREFVHSTFKGLGIDAPLSNTNFLFVSLDRPVGDFRDACLEHRVQVGRNFPPMLDHCRVSLGTMGEMRRASGVFAEVLRTGYSSLKVVCPALVARIRSATFDFDV